MVSLLCYWDDFGGAQAEGGTPGVHQRITAPGLFFHGGTIDILVYVRTGIGAKLIFAGVGAVGTCSSFLVRSHSSVVSRSVILASIEVD